MTFSGTPCYDAGYKVGENYTGVAVVDGLDGENKIIFISTNSMENRGILFI